MAPRVTFQMEGSLRKKIFDNSQILWPIIAENKLANLEGKTPSIKTLDDESKVIVEAKGSSVTTQFIYTVDVDEKPGNGRVYVEDQFVYDAGSKKFECQRNFRMLPGTDIQSWENFLNRLKERQAKQPFRAENPEVIKFFEKVVLELPTPVAVEGGEDSDSPDSPPLRLPDPVITGMSAPTLPYNLEASHFRRMWGTLPALADAFQKVPGSSQELKEGLYFLRNGFLKKNPAWEKLHQQSLGDPSLHLLSGALMALSKGDLKSARIRLVALRPSHPVAGDLIAWIDGYERALKNLYLLRPARSLALEETDRRLKAGAAWLVPGGETLRPEKVKRIFQTVERKIVMGEADTLDQAFKQILSSTSQDASLAELLLSKNFAQQTLSDLAQVGNLSPSLSDPLLLTIAREKWVPLGYASVTPLFDDLGEYSKERAVALASRKSLGHAWGLAPFSEQLDLGLTRSIEGLSDPILIGSLLLGQGAYRFGQRYALTRFGGLGFRTTLAATALGVSAEAPAFELAHRVLNLGFAGEVPHSSFLAGSARNWFTFGALRGAGLGVHAHSERIVALSPYSPLGRYTLPLAEHGASFGALHLTNEGERAVGLRPATGPWGSRLMSDGVFYFQAGLASYLAGLGASRKTAEEIQGLTAFNRLSVEAKAFKPQPREIKLLPPHIDEGPKTGEPDTPPLPLPAVEPAVSVIPEVYRILNRGESVLATANNEPQNPRRAEVFLKIPNYGEVAAYTHEGIDKKHMDGKRPHAVNEDAFGLTVDAEGRPFLMVADGMGGHGVGEAASKIGVERSIQAVSEGQATTPGRAFQLADQAIREMSKDPIAAWRAAGAKGEMPTSGTTASAVRINPDGTVEAALTGDARVWILRSRADGGYDVFEPVLPHFEPTAFRLSGLVKNSFQMNAHEKANKVLSGLGQSNVPHLTQAFDYGEVGKAAAVSNQIYDSVLTFPTASDPASPREPFKLQPGDSLLLMSDGVANFFNRAQMAKVVEGKKDAQEMLKAIQKESQYRFAIFMGLVKAPMGSGRMKVKVGAFEGQYIDARGKIYGSKDLNDTDLTGQVGRDNVVALLYRHNPAPEEGPSAASSGAPEEAPTTIAILPGEHHLMTDLLGRSDSGGFLERIRLRRGLNDAASSYWLLMPGGGELTLTREFGEVAGKPVILSGGEHRIAGEIGETIRLQLKDSQLPPFKMFLDGPRGEGQRLPVAHLSYGGKEMETRFRSTTPEISFGRRFNAGFFEGAGERIPEHYFDVSATLKYQDRGYRIIARATEGVFVGDKFLGQGQELFVMPGSYSIRPADSAGAVKAGSEPVVLTLPNVEVLFPEWLPKETATLSPSGFPPGAPSIFESWITTGRNFYQRILKWSRDSKGEK